MEIKCTYMRGGTSKGLMFRKDDLPENRALWDEIFIKAMGSPDPKQADGMGGMISTNNKIMIAWRSEEEGIDVDYLFAQVIPGRRAVDYSANCGNMTSAVGPFSIMSGLVPAKDGMMTVRMRNMNTNKLVEEGVPVKDGQVVETGDCYIAGLDSPGAELQVNFLNPGGSSTGRLLPTGNVVDEIDGLRVSVIDLTNVFVFIRAADLGLKGTETPDVLESNKEMHRRVERIRAQIAQKIGFVERWEDASTKTAGSPKVVIVSPPLTYTDNTGKTMCAKDMDLSVRVISLEKVHLSSPLTGAVAIGGAAFIEGSLAHEVVQGRELTDSVRFGHPCGIVKVYAHYEKSAGQTVFTGIAAQRTARRIMQGTLYIREDDRDDKVIR